MVDQPMPGNDSSEKATNDFAHFLSTVTTVQQDFSSLAHFYAICVQISHEISAQREGEGSRPFLRLYGMGVPVSNDRTCLLSFDYRLDESHPETGYWQTLMDPALVKPIGKLSLEEELLRERKRSFASMFLTVDFSPKHNAFLYAQCGEVFEFQDNPSQGGNSVNSFPNSIGNPVNLVYCPDKPQYFAMVIGNDVYVYNKQTSFCSIARPTECDWIYGSPPFVIQEEFERFEGIWWCPKNEQQTLLLVEAYNQRTVQKVTLGLGTCGGDLERISYPYAGTDNALWNLKLYALSERDDQFSLVNCPFKYDFNALFPWAEYLVKCGWLPDGSAIWLLLMDRLQRLVRLVYVPLHCFAIDSLSCKTGHQRGITVVYEETSNHWLPAHNSLVLLQPKYKDSIRFTWLSRKSGFSHLYLVDAALSCEEDDEPKPCARVKETVDIIEEVQLTAGEWDVSLSARIEVDEARSLIYFLAVADTPLESHIYVTSYSTPGMNPVRLSEPGYSYGIPRERKCIIFNDDHSIMATFRSSVTCPGESIVYSLSFPEHGNESDPLTPCVKDLILLKMPSKEVNDYSTSQDSAENNISIKCLAEHRLLRGVPPRPLVVELQFDTFKLYSYLYRPFDWKEGEVCPTVVYVYGGPGFQLVRNSWTRHIFLTMYLNLGYAVVMTDGRGSLNRGSQFETAISGRLGNVEVEDQVNALIKIGELYGTIDMSRVALMGWSYGGYLALMGLAQHPEVFKVAIAGAPVTDWRFYDTAYTERYLGLPENNQAAYEESSVVSLVNKFPSVAGRLLLLHGMRDENVHFRHTTTLVQALIDAGKPYSLQTYPDERHAFRNASATSHMFATILNFLDLNL